MGKTLTSVAVWPEGGAGYAVIISRLCWYSPWSGNAENLSETIPASARVMQRFLAESYSLG